MKVLLIKPPFNRISIVGDSLLEPLELEILAATIPEHDCKILDMRINPNLPKVLGEFQPDLVGITGYTIDVPTIRSLLRRTKQISAECFTVVGGCHASILPNDFFGPDLDALVVGSGEEAFPGLVNQLSADRDLSPVRSLWIRKGDRFFFTGEGHPLTDLNRLPEPNRQLTAEYRHRYHFGTYRPAAAVMTSRGCPFRCSFCCIWKLMQGRFLTREASRVASEISKIQETHVFIADDSTFSHARHAEALYQSLKDLGVQKSYKMFARADSIVARPDLIEKWRGIGLKTVVVGLESFQNHRLEALNKRITVEIQSQALQVLKANDFKVRAYFILEPDYTRQDFEDLMEYYQKFSDSITEPIFTVLTPLPGTDFYNDMQGKLLFNQYEFFDLIHSLLPTKLPRKEFYREFSDLYRKCYPLKRVFKKIVTPLSVKRLLGGFLFFLRASSYIRRVRNIYKIEARIDRQEMTDH